MAFHFDTNRKGFTFTWILENFEYCWQKTGEELRSPTFIVDTMERTKWHLSIYPRGDESDRWVSLYLNRGSDSKGPATYDVYFEFAFLASDGSVLTSDEADKDTISKGDDFGYSEFEERESVSKFLSLGTLTIRCRMWKSNQEVTRDGQCIARTRIGVERKSFLWEIKNFSTSVGREIPFKLKSTSDDKLIMSLKLFLRQPNGLGRDSNNILIKFTNSGQRSVFSTFKSSLVDVKGNYVDCGENGFFLSSAAESAEYALSLSKDTLMKNNDLYLPNGILTLYFEYAFSTGVAYGEIEATSYGCSNSLIKNSVVPEITNSVEILDDSNASTDLNTDLRSLLQDSILCDVKLCAQSETFPAHWIILSARSPVFRAMFNSDMKEKAKDRIDIIDLKPDTIRRMLAYIYTDSLEELQWETASDLYIAAEKYQILSLKDKCSSFLKTNLNLTNACEILLVADLHQDKELKSRVQDFILENDKILINSNEWKNLMQANLNLAAETMLLRFKE